MSDSDEGRDSSENKKQRQDGSPYAAGGGGTTFERRVAVKFLAHLLVGDGSIEIGEGRRVMSVAFQQASDYPVDDLVVSASYHGELEPSLVLALAVRRKPKFIKSNKPTCKLVRTFVSAVRNMPVDGAERRLGIVVAGYQPHAEQISFLAEHAATQMDASGFFDLIRTPGKFRNNIRERLQHLEDLVEHSLCDINGTEVAKVEVQQYTWRLLKCLTVSMLRLETPDETDWATVANRLVPISRGSNLTSASNLRDRLFDLASDYSPKAAHVDLFMLRRDTHTLLKLTARSNEQGWKVLDLLNRQALEVVRTEIVSTDSSRCVCLDRSNQINELSKNVTDALAVVVKGESGVGKSALAVQGLTVVAEEKPDEIQLSCINLRHIPKLSIDLKNQFGVPLSELLSEMSAPQRILVVDGADAVAEDMEAVFRYLLEAARKTDVKIVAVVSDDSCVIVQDILRENFDDQVKEHVVAPLTDAELDEIVRTFPELQRLSANPKSRELLRRLVVVDLLVRSNIQDVLVSDADAMNEIWSGLVRRHEKSDRGTPDMREIVLLDLADLALRSAGSDERRKVIKGFDPTALYGLRRDGLLRTSQENPFGIGPEFSHDEVRRYAIAHLFLSDRKPAEKIKEYGAPRWSLSAAQLACQALLAEPDTANNPLPDRFGRLQVSFDRLVELGHGVRWADVPSEVLITLSNPSPVLQDAWSGMMEKDAAGLKRLERIVDQRLRKNHGFINPFALEPIIELLFRDHFPWKSGEYARRLLREWLHGHIAANTAAGHELRTQFRDRLMDAFNEAERRFTEEQEARNAALAARTPEEVEQDSQIAEILALARRDQSPRPKIPGEILDEVFLELLVLLGPDLGIKGEEILRLVGEGAPEWLAPVVEEPLVDRALASYGQGLLAYLTEAYYIDVETENYDLYDCGIRRHNSCDISPSSRSAWWRGPFFHLLQSDFSSGVEVINRLLNHATLVRARKFSQRSSSDQQIKADTTDLQMALEINGKRQVYFGDVQVWRWYRGSNFGLFPYMSALQALERECDSWIKEGQSIESLISVLLASCKNLAMVGLIVGLLVRHLEKAGRLLDPFLTEPLVWEYERTRTLAERTGQTNNTNELDTQERRYWSFEETAKFVVVRARGERLEQLKTLGQKLIQNAYLQLGLAPNHEREGDESTEYVDPNLDQVRLWASSLDRNSYKSQVTQDGLEISFYPPEDIVDRIQRASEDRQPELRFFDLRYRFSITPNRLPSEQIEKDELESGLSIARQLRESPTSWGTIYFGSEVSALIASAALKAHLLHGSELSNENLVFAACIILKIGQGKAEASSPTNDFSYYEDGADRSAARAIPLLLLPRAASIRADVDKSEGLRTKYRKGTVRTVIQRISGKRTELTASECIFQAGLNLARASFYEVRLHLARGLDHVWQTPCAGEGRCHHDVGWHLVRETMRDCILGDFDSKAQRRSVIKLKEPFAKSLPKLDRESIYIPRLDAAIRALAPAVMAKTCVSDQAKSLLLELLDAQRRALLLHGKARTEYRDSHTLVSARALLTLVKQGDNLALFEHIDAYINHPALLSTLLHALCAVAEETQNRAVTARRIWPAVMRHVLSKVDSEPLLFQDSSIENRVIEYLLPNPSFQFPYLYMEIQDKPIVWWDPISINSEVEEWLVHAKGRASCVGRLIGFISVLTLEMQIQKGIPWIAKLVLSGDSRNACRTWSLSDWLVKVRPGVHGTELFNLWQDIVDTAVVAGETILAPYSE